MDDIVSHSSPLFFLKTSKKWGNSCRCREKFISLQGNILLTHAYRHRGAVPVCAPRVRSELN